MPLTNRVGEVAVSRRSKATAEASASAFPVVRRSS
jgi:hypothetical protein